MNIRVKTTKYLLFILLLFFEVYGADFSGKFNKLRAYEHLVNQCNFGPRVPGSEAHLKCLEYIKEGLEKSGFKVELQTFKKYSSLLGQEIELVNIVGIINPDIKKRICLSAHWDTRPIAEEDMKDKNSPIPGANDGASGVGILLEVARVLSENKPECGVMIVFFDGEDLGFKEKISEYCLGSQYFAENALDKYPFDLGINIDLVGDKDLVLKKEIYSLHSSNETVDRIWEIGKSISRKAFSDEQGRMILDDSVPFIQKGKKYINLIDYDYTYWHTLADTPDKCSPESLDIIGKTLLKFIYKEFCKN